MKLSKYIAELEEAQVTMAESISLQVELGHSVNGAILEHSSMIIGDIIKKLKTVKEI